MRPLQGVRVMDLSWLLAGAGAPRLLAALGAEVIRVEWREKLDFIRFVRASFPPYRNPERTELPRTVNRSGIFNDINAGKRGISLNMREPKGRELFQRMVALSDIVVENFTAEVMTRWGLDYQALKAIKHDIIYVQQPGFGFKGPYSKFTSYGPIAQALSGLTEESGLPDPHPPAGWGYSYMDWTGAYYCAMAMLMALYHKKRTGEGQYIDSSQIEPGIFISGTAVLDYSANGRHYSRTGNRSPYHAAAPHGIYRCAGDDRWIAIAATTEEEWRALAAEMGDPAWTRDARFATMAERVRHQDELDRQVEEWTREQEPFGLQQRLQARAVPAGVCQNAKDRVEDDPQLKHLNWLRPLPHSELGTWPIKDVPFHFSEAQVDQGGPGGRAAPCYGEDNDYVYRELLQLSAEEIAQLKADNII